MTGRLRIAVAGAGLIGRAHIERIQQSTACRLAAIADPGPPAAAYAKEQGAPYYADLEAMLDAETPDGVIVATPNVTHAGNAIACIERGIPVLIEKPVTETAEKAEQVIAAAEKHGVATLVGHHRRHSPILQEARKAVREGRLGRLATVTAFVTFLKPEPYFDVAWRREPGGGPIMINLIHAIDDLRFLCGDFASLQAITSNSLRGFAVEDSAAISFRLVNGALGTITLSDKAAAPWSWELTARENPAYPSMPEDCYFIAGIEGALAVPSLRHWRYDAETPGWNAPLLSEQLPLDRSDPLVNQLAHFCDVIRGKAASINDARDGLHTLQTTLAVYAAAEQGRVISLTTE